MAVHTRMHVNFLEEKSHRTSQSSLKQKGTLTESARATDDLIKEAFQAVYERPSSHQKSLSWPTKRAQRCSGIASSKVSASAKVNVSRLVAERAAWNEYRSSESYKLSRSRNKQSLWCSLKHAVIVRGVDFEQDDYIFRLLLSTLKKYLATAKRVSIKNCYLSHKHLGLLLECLASPDGCLVLDLSDSDVPDNGEDTIRQLLIKQPQSCVRVVFVFNPWQPDSKRVTIRNKTPANSLRYRAANSLRYRALMSSADNVVESYIKRQAGQAMLTVKRGKRGKRQVQILKLRKQLSNIRRSRRDCSKPSNKLFLTLRWNMPYPSLKVRKRFVHEVEKGLRLICGLSSSDRCIQAVGTYNFKARFNVQIQVINVQDDAHELLNSATLIANHLRRIVQLPGEEEEENILSKAEIVARDDPNQRPSCARKFPRVLLIDGGGIKGLAALANLKRIEQRLHREYHQGLRLCDVFDTFVGTSVGGIIALACVRGQSVDEIIHVFLRISRQVFPNDTELAKVLKTPFRAFQLFQGGWYGTESQLGDAIDAEFGKRRTLGQVCGDKTVLLTTVELPSTARLLSSIADADMTVRKALRMTSAAPGYLRPVMWNPRPHDPASVERNYVDGGVRANCPLHLFAQEHHINPPAPDEKNKGVIVSVGCGTMPAGKETSSQNFVWKALLTGIIESATECDACFKLGKVELKAQCHGGGWGWKFHRIQPQHDYAYKMDDSSDHSINGLAATAWPRAVHCESPLKVLKDLVHKDI